MIRLLRRRFVLSGMAAFGILLLILLCGITVSSYWRVESAEDVMLDALIESGELRAADPAPAQRGGRSFVLNPVQPQGRIGHYIITVDAQGAIAEIEEKGMWEPDYDQAEDYALQILESGKENGRIDSYKYRMRTEADGSARVVLLDNSIQIHMLTDMLRTVGLLSLGCLALLFLILLPISNRLVRSYAAHIEKQKQFITNAGHDIKTPVAIIMSNVDAMELIQGENKWSRNIRGQTERLNALLQRLLFLARIDERSVAPATEELELNALLGAELETYGEIIGEKNIHLDCDLSASLRMKGSREYMQQLIHVLLDNAVQYVNMDGSIGLQLEKRRQKVRMQLSNTVDALPDCPPEALFDRFYRGDSARTQSGGGYGIGLSAARAICEMHHGRISAEYEGENRIVFTVELPVKA